MNPFDIQELMEATNLHNRLKKERAELRATQRLNFDALELQHAKERINHPQTPELIARQKAEFIASQQAFESYYVKMDARQKEEREQFEREQRCGDPQRNRPRIDLVAQSQMVRGDRHARPCRRRQGRALAGHDQGRFHPRIALAGPGQPGRAAKRCMRIDVPVSAPHASCARSPNE